MRIALIYIEAGKGHYIPSVAICEALVQQGHDARYFNGFTEVFDRPDIGEMASTWWRTMLHMPNVERKLEYILDRIPYVSKKSYKIAKKSIESFFIWLDEFKPDVIVPTQYSFSYVIPEIIHEFNLPICCITYSPDTYVTPIQSINPHTYRYLIASEEGRQDLISHGVEPDRVDLCAFPLRNDCYRQKQLTKQEARTKLGIKDKFTVLINLGGEGIASIKIIESVLKEDSEVQFLIVGKLGESALQDINAIRDEHPGSGIVTPGFVTNINEWLYASDILVGKAGPNAMTEALYCRRPYIVTSLLYMSDKVVGYFTKYHVGWYTNKVKEQVRLILEAKNDPDFSAKMDKYFDSVPMVFGADKISKQIVAIAEEYFREHPKSR